MLLVNVFLNNKNVFIYYYREITEGNTKEFRIDEKFFPVAHKFENFFIDRPVSEKTILNLLKT